MKEKLVKWKRQCIFVRTKTDNMQTMKITSLTKVTNTVKDTVTWSMTINDYMNVMMDEWEARRLKMQMIDPTVEEYENKKLGIKTITYKNK